MTNRDRIKAVLNYEKYDRMPVIAFGYWHETLEKWHSEGHITLEESLNYRDNNLEDKSIMKKLGFDFNWNPAYWSKTLLFPEFETKILEKLPDDKVKKLNYNGVIVIEKEGLVTMPHEVGHSLTDRKSWEELYLPKLQYSAERTDFAWYEQFRDDANRENPLGLFCGSLMGNLRNLTGVEGLSYIYCDDEDLLKEMVNTIGDVCYKVTENLLKTGIKFDYAHFWEDIAFKNGPLVIPSMFDELAGPHYKKITKLLKEHGINIVSVDCDGMIDSLIPTWVENGVNTMFPIEVGTWNAYLTPWREQYGKEIRGVGGMNKNVFARDYKAIDAEIERLKPIVELGGYIPCPDHRIPPDAIWENVQYYCEKMKEL